MILVMDPATDARVNSRWFIGLSVMLFSLVVLAEDATRLEISPAYDDDRVTDAIYNSANGWRKPPEYESEWRPQRQMHESRIQFGYDSAYEEMRTSGNDNSLDTGLGVIDHPQNTQLKINF